MSANATSASPAKEKRTPLLRGRGYRVRVLFALIDVFYWVFYAGERVLGSWIVALLEPPFIAGDLWRRRHDFDKFKKLREILPAEFWKGIPVRDHYYRMVRNWNECGGVALLYARLGRSYWKKRFTVKGPMPTEHPEWGKRPVIFAFMHTGSFGVLMPWLRAQGIAAAGMVGGLPLMMDNHAFAKRAEAADLAYGLAGVPMVFDRENPLRESTLRDVLRFLTPGNCVLIALDGGKRSDELEKCSVGGQPIFIRKGAGRIAAQTGALLIPISMRHTGMCRFEVNFGQPVPDELLQRGEFPAALQHMVNELWTDIEAHPDDLNWTTLEALAPELRLKRVGWP